MLEEQNILNLYYDHYKDTQEIIRGFVAKRDKYTIILLCVVAVISYVTIDAAACSRIINEILNDKFGLSAISFQVINAIFLSILLFVSLQYYQICLNIEKWYRYIHNVENTLSEMSQMNIDRESKSYLNNYPKTQDLAHSLYTYIFPFIIIAISIYKLVIELHSNNYATMIVDGILICVTIICSVAYLIDRICMQKSITWRDIFITPFRNVAIWLKNHLCCVICFTIFIVLSSVLIYLVVQSRLISENEVLQLSDESDTYKLLGMQIDIDY